MRVSSCWGCDLQNCLFETLLFGFPNGSVNIYDRELRYVCVGGQGLETVGLTAGYLQGRTLYDLFPLDSVALVEPFYRRALAGEPGRFRLQLFGRDYHISVAPFQYMEGEVATIIAVAQDITADEGDTPAG